MRRAVRTNPESHALLESVVRNREFLRATGFDRSGRIGPFHAGWLRFVVALLIPLAVVSMMSAYGVMGRANSYNAFLLFVAIVPFGLLIFSVISATRHAAAPHIEIPDDPTRNKAELGEDIVGRLAGESLALFAFVVGVQVGALAWLWNSLELQSVPAEATFLVSVNYMLALIGPLIVEIPLRALRGRYGVGFFETAPAKPTLIPGFIKFFALLAGVLLYEQQVSDWGRPRLGPLDITVVTGILIFIFVSQMRRSYRVIIETPRLLELTEWSPNEMLRYAPLPELSIRTLRSFIAGLRENPVFLRTAGFMYTKRYGRWPEGVLRIGLIVIMIPLLQLLVGILGLRHHGVFGLIVLVTASFIAPLMAIAAAGDTIKSARLIDAKRVDGPLALTRLTFADIAAGRTVGSAVFPILTALVLTIIAVGFLLYWVVFDRRLGSDYLGITPIFAMLVWAPIMPELAIRVLRGVVAGSSTPWISALYIATIPLQYLAFSLVSIYVENKIFGHSWGNFYTRFVEGDPVPLVLVGGILIYFCMWRWKICWYLIHSAGAAMEANMRAWWESGEHE
jgi:hypothetical protein